jgi:tagaturonate reductase
MAITNHTQAPSILQFGGGVFLRAFLGSIVEEANTRFGKQEGIALVERSRSEASTILRTQNGEYTVVSEGFVSGREVRKATRIHAVSEMLSADTDWERVLAISASEELRCIVSNATEAGIIFDGSDADRIQSGLVPHSFPGKLTACLFHRWKARNGKASGLYVLPTELIENNGTTLEKIVYELIAHAKLEEDFTQWLHTHVHFCNTLVDRIVPGTPDEITRAKYAEWLGYNDHALITAEPYRLWAIQGDAGVKAALAFADCSGVVVKPDIREERTLKVRILNAGHTLMAPRGMAKGLKTVLDVMQDAELSELIEMALRTEVAPTLEYTPQRIQQYISDVLDRFRNPFLQHHLSAIRKGEELKFQMRVQPSIDGYRQKFGKEPNLLSIHKLTPLM